MNYEYIFLMVNFLVILELIIALLFYFKKMYVATIYPYPLRELYSSQ